VFTQIKRDSFGTILTSFLAASSIAMVVWEQRPSAVRSSEARLGFVGAPHNFHSTWPSRNPLTVR
jgi:hypothetical protein